METLNKLFSEAIIDLSTEGMLESIKEKHESHKEEMIHQVIAYLRKLEKDKILGKTEIGGIECAAEMLREGVIPTSTFLAIVQAIQSPELPYIITQTK